MIRQVDTRIIATTQDFPTMKINIDIKVFSIYLIIIVYFKKYEF